MSRNSKTQFIPLCLVSIVLTGGLAGCGSALPFGPEAEAQKAAQERYAKAKALFEERCKTAGVVIKRTVKDVEGIELTKIRQLIPWGGKEYFDPMFPEAAMAGEHRGDAYINQFLMTESIDWRDPNRRGSLNSPDFDTGSKFPLKRGYQFVEVVAPVTHTRYLAQLGKYPPGTNLWVKPPMLTPVTKSSTRYALDYEDIVDPAERQLWIAGTRLKVIDKERDEVIAVLTRYVWDAGFGVSSTGRWPWSYAAMSGSGECPNLPGAKSDISRKFVDTVLIPKQGE